MKTILTNPELCIPGQKCKILIPSKWIGAYEALKNGEINVWLPAKIKKVHYDKTDKSLISAVTVDVRASNKYHTCRVENMFSVRSQFDTIIFK